MMESGLEECDTESEVRVSCVPVAGWRVKEKTADMRKGRGFQGQQSMPDRCGFSGR